MSAKYRARGIPKGRRPDLPEAQLEIMQKALCALNDWYSGTPGRELARVYGVSERTIDRWIAGAKRSLAAWQKGEEHEQRNTD